ncbi:MAG: cation:proton antiporter [Spirochaetaceae bacterium]|nr:MAG: cation:proton antiporter [Spirochaetaceae bacterium]
MLQTVIGILLLSAIATFVRLIRGPSVPDRIVAANSVGLMLFALIVILAVLFETESFLDIALVYSVLQFIDILILSKYLNRQGAYRDRS